MSRTPKSVLQRRERFLQRSTHLFESGDRAILVKVHRGKEVKTAVTVGDKLGIVFTLLRFAVATEYQVFSDHGGELVVPRRELRPYNLLDHIANALNRSDEE